MRWILKPPDERAARLAQQAAISPLLARLLLARGVEDAAQAGRFLRPTLEHLHSPGLMRGMREAAARLRAAIKRGERILIYGDYDVDGTVAIVILKTAIELCGGAAEFHVPHRIREGYGMRDEVIEQAAAAGVRLIISVDTGIRAFAAAEAARRAGVDLIVTDHHLPEGAGVPPALAVLNPNQPGCDYPCKDLCGAGVAFKLAQALLEENGRQRYLTSFLKMLAIATIADAVPLAGENRAIAWLGLEGLRRPANPGLKALFEVAKLDPAAGLSAHDIGFRVAPRINAAGRMDVARDVIELFSTRDDARAREIALRLDQLNSERQAEEARIVAEIEERLVKDESLASAYCLVLEGAGWHRGVIGIAATRVVERTGHPALVISLEGDEAHGSGRSIHSFHLLNALEDPACRPLFSRYGGHAYAVGFGLPAASIPALRAAIEAHARTRLTPEDFAPALTLDAELASSDISPALVDELRQLEPFGAGNREPVFCMRSAKLLAPPFILKEKHMKLRLADASTNGIGLAALGWRMAERLQAQPLLPGDTLNVAFKVEENRNPGFGGLQLILSDYIKLN